MFLNSVEGIRVGMRNLGIRGSRGELNFRASSTRANLIALVRKGLSQTQHTLTPEFDDSRNKSTLGFGFIQRQVLSLEFLVCMNSP